MIQKPASATSARIAIAMPPAGATDDEQDDRRGRAGAQADLQLPLHAARARDPALEVLAAIHAASIGRAPVRAP